MIASNIKRRGRAVCTFCDTLLFEDSHAAIIKAGKNNLFVHEECFDKGVAGSSRPLLSETVHLLPKRNF
jgi:hypothetical protein